MERDDAKGPILDELPREAADRVTRPLTRFLKIESAAGVILLGATLVALVLSNSPMSSAYQDLWETRVGLTFGSVDFTRTLRHWINDGLMTVFFFVVSLELKREIVHGPLRSFRMAAFSLAGAAGGMVVPAALYVAVVGAGPGSRGWGTVMATDTAFVIGALALLGSRIPGSLRLFLLSLAIFDDVGAILVVAVGYGADLALPALGAAAGFLVVILAAARMGIRSVFVYTLFGAGLWLALDRSGIHPTIAGVLLGLMTPAREWVSDQRLHAILERVLAYPVGAHWSGDTADRDDLLRARVAAKEALSPVERIELALHPWSAFVIMPVFALANAGVVITWATLDEPITQGVFVGLAVGKPLGVVALSWLAVRLKVAKRPVHLRWSLVAGGAALTGIGFTMSLFIAGLAFDAEALRAAKVGILSASVISGAVGVLTLAWLTSAKRTDAHKVGEAADAWV